MAASQDNRPLSPRTMDLAAYWHSGTTGREHYRAFLHRLITEQLSEEEDVLYGRTDIPRLRDDWLPSEDGGHLYVDVHMTVSKATSMAAAAVIPPEGREGGPRDVIIEIEGIEEHAELAAFVLPTVSLYGDTRLSEGARLVLDEKRGEYRPSMRMSPPRVTLEEDESLLLTLFGHEDDVTGQVRVRTMAPPLRVELAPGPQRPGLPVREDPTREAPMFTGVEPEGEHVLRARLGPLDEETEKVEIHWSAPCDPHRGSPITAEISEDERIEGVAMEWPCKIAPRPGYHEIEVRLVEVPALGRRRQIAKEARGLYVAVISEAFGASRHVEVGGRRLPAVGAEVRISAEPRSGDYRYRWSMGDGSTRITSEPRVTHTYEKAGSYRIGLELLSSQEGQAEVLGSARPRVIVIGEERRRPSREREPPVAASDPEPSRRDELREMVTRHPNGNIRERYTYFEGEGAGPGRIVRHGEHETFAEDGTRTLLGRYERGQLEGRFQRWWANGNKRMEAHYVGGSRHGQYREWHMNGKPSVEGRYVDGQRDGVWTHFDQGGSKTGQVTWREGARAR